MGKKRKQGLKRIKKPKVQKGQQKQENIKKVEQIKEEPKCEVNPECYFEKICCPTYHRVCNARVKCCKDCIDGAFCPMIPHICSKK